MENHSTPDSSGTQVPASSSSGRRQSNTTRRRGSTEGAEDAQEDADEESSSSSASETPQPQPQQEALLETFRQQWEAELKKAPNVTSTSTSNMHSALNLVTATAASLANPFPNPTSMAGAVSSRPKKDPISPYHHPFASGVVSSVVVSERGGEDGPIEQIAANAVSSHQISADVPNTGTIEEQSRRWFLQGVGFERHGDLYDAVRCYRRAIQLVPDIEYRISQGLVEDSGGGGSSNSLGLDEEDDEDERSDVDQDFDRDSDDEDNEKDATLIKRFLKQIEQREWVFFQKISANDKGHIADLPVEVVSYILRWVVSSDLDIRSLDMLSLVCKGFYVIARDDKLWQMACERVWSSCVIDSSLYNCYRDMFLRRPRVRLDGCYISKVTYIRAGEQSFQDQFYRPWHFVEYYRYIRFFPDGTVHFLTSTEEPCVALPGLRDKNPKNQATLTGTYKMYGSNIISAVVANQTQPKSGFSNKAKRNETQQNTSFHIELQICLVKGRPNWMLKWTHHAVFIKKTTALNGRNARQKATSTITSTSLELSPTKYPPLLWSGVKSYTTKSEKILE